MNIVSIYLLVYYKKGKQHLRVLPRKTLLRWIKKNQDVERQIFKLDQVEFTMSDTYEVE
jgi:hypothetical protein